MFFFSSFSILNTWRKRRSEFVSIWLINHQILSIRLWDVQTLCSSFYNTYFITEHVRYAMIVVMDAPAMRPGRSIVRTLCLIKLGYRKVWLLLISKDEVLKISIRTYRLWKVQISLMKVDRLTSGFMLLDENSLNAIHAYRKSVISKWRCFRDSSKDVADELEILSHNSLYHSYRMIFIYNRCKVLVIKIYDRLVRKKLFSRLMVVRMLSVTVLKT